MLRLLVRLFFCCSYFFLVSCNEKSIEAEFFYNERNRINREVELEKYPLEQQYRIFKYGNQVIHPPQKSLARVVAKRGKPALDYVLEQVRNHQDDLDIRDSMVIFTALERGGYYSVCEDAQVMEEIKANENKIQHAGWREVYHQMLETLCN